MFESLQLSDEEAVVTIAKSDQLESIAAGLSDGSISFIDIQEVQVTKTYKIHSEPITDVKSSSSDANMFGTSSQDGSLALWDIRCHELLYQYPIAQEEVWSIEFAPDAPVVAAGLNSDIQFFDLRVFSSSSSSSSSPLIGSYSESHSDDVSILSFHPHHTSLLVSSGEDGLICLYETDNNQEGHDDDVISGIFNTSFVKI